MSDHLHLSIPAALFLLLIAQVELVKFKIFIDSASREFDETLGHADLIFRNPREARITQTICTQLI